MPTTIQYDVSIDDYHRSPHLSTSKLKDFASRGARFFAAKHITRTAKPEPDSDALIFGQVVEDIIQQRGLDLKTYAVKPDGMTFATKDGKAWRAEQTDAGKKIVSQDDIDRMVAMRESLQENETAVGLIRCCKQQATIRAEWSGTPGLQARPDWFSEDGCAVSGFESFSLDLKSTRTLAKLASGRGVLEHGYHAQASLIAAMVPSRQYLLAVEKQMPYRAQVIRIPAPWVDLGWRWCLAQLYKLKQHYESQTWPRVDRELIELPALPAWADREVFEDEGEAA